MGAHRPSTGAPSVTRAPPREERAERGRLIGSAGSRAAGSAEEAAVAEKAA